MSMMSMKALVRGAAVALVVCAAPALAGPWSSPNGASDSFSYANGGDLNGNFGEPFVASDTFFFINANFQVNAANGTSDSESDVVSFDVTANDNLYFTLIRVTAFGTYAATGPGENSVDITGELSLTENGGLNRNWVGPLNTNPLFPKSNDNGEWSGLSVVDITFEFPTPHNSLHVAMSNDVVAITGIGGSAEMNVQYQDLKIEFAVIPEPASIALLALGGLALVRRRR